MEDAAGLLELSEASGPTPSTVERVFASMPEAVVATDQDHRIVVVNAATVRLFGYTPAELEGQLIDVLQENAELVQGSGASLLAVDGNASHCATFRRKDGTTFQGEASVAELCDARGQKSGYVRTIRDATDGVAAEHAMHCLHQVATTPGLCFETRLERMLELGCRHFGLEVGMVCRIQDDECRVLNARSRGRSVSLGEAFSLSSTALAAELTTVGPVGRHQIAKPSSAGSDPMATVGAYLGAPLMVDGEHFGTVCFHSPLAARPFSPRKMTLLSLVATWIEHELARDRQDRALEAAQAELQLLATTDELTALLNRRAFTERLDWEVRRARRKPDPFVLAFADIDHFKRVNDTHGHGAGDEALRQFGAICVESLREVDVIARWGGEEFAFLLSMTNIAGARICMERVRARLENLQLHSDEGMPFRVTVSIGAVEWHADSDSNRLVRHADQALYHAKRTGRNRFVPFVPGLTPSLSQSMRRVDCP